MILDYYSGLVAFGSVIAAICGTYINFRIHSKISIPDIMKVKAFEGVSEYELFRKVFAGNGRLAFWQLAITMLLACVFFKLAFD